MKITYYVHGSTKDNEVNIASGWTQNSLSQKGVEQTIIAAKSIEAAKYDRIFASDLLRAIESAQILFSEDKDSIAVDARLRECNYGAFTKKPSNDLVYVNHIHIPFPDGESLYDVELRVREFLEEMKSLSYNHIAIVGHRAPQLALDVITRNFTWELAIDHDWRIGGNWQLCWEYTFL